MIKANQKKYADLIFEPYIKNLMYKNFNSFHLFGDIPKVDPNYSLLLVANHSSWWDGFFTYYLNKLYFNRKFYIMMLEDQLEKFKFFNKLGAYSIKHDSPKSILKTINYTKDILQNDNNAFVNIYPEGKMQASFNNDISFQGGIGKVLQNLENPVNVVCLSMKIISLFEQRPQVFFKFSSNLISDPTSPLALDSLNEQTKSNLIQIDQNIMNEVYGKIIFEGKKSRSE